jgi:O-antigen ligase
MFSDHTATSKLPPYALTAALLLAVAGFTVCVMWLWPASMLDSDTMALMLVVIFALAVLYAGLAVCRTTLADADSTVLRLSLLIWFILLISEGLFDRAGDEVDTYKGLITSQAYGEAIVWVVAAAILLLVLLPHLGHLRPLFAKNYKWATIYVLVCLLSVTYSPDKTYSLAWCFKLGLVVLLLGVCIPTVSSVAKAILFLRITLWGLLFLTFIPVLIALWDPEGAFSGAGGRLLDPVLLSQRGGFVFLIATVLYSLQRRRLFLVVSIVGAAVMVMAFGKTSIIAGTFSAGLFLILQGKRKAAGLLFGGLLVLTLVILVTVPQVSRYASSYEGTDTLTGRTNVWEMALPRIKQRPLQGYGYLATKFMWLSEREKVATFTHLHNSFLDVAYNLGLLGLVPMIMMHVGLVKNLRRSMRNAKAPPTIGSDASERRSSRTLYLVAAGCLILYVDLLINGMMTTTFGGRPNCLFMSFLAVLALSEVVYRESLGLVGAPATVKPSRFRSVPLSPRTFPSA